MQEILIRPELLKLVRDGKKTTTCRLGKRDYALSKTKLKSNTNDQDYTYINIKKLRYTKVSDMTDEMALDDGFKSKQNLLDVLNEIYGEIKETDDITIVIFELSK